MTLASTRAVPAVPIPPTPAVDPESQAAVAFIAAVTDASFSDAPSTPLIAVWAAVTNETSNGDVAPAPAAAVFVVKSYATAILFSNSRNPGLGIPHGRRFLA